LLGADRGEQPRLQRRVGQFRRQRPAEPAVASRCNVSRTVDGARFSRRAISLPEIPAVLKRSTSRTWRIAVLSVGIRSRSATAKGQTVNSQQRRRSDRRPSGRHHPGTASEIISERRATSNRIGRRHHDFARNQHPGRTRNRSLGSKPQQHTGPSPDCTPRSATLPRAYCRTCRRAGPDAGANSPQCLDQSRVR